MNEIDYQQIIKWVIIVIAAGFLGQFGKSFATYLIERARKKKAHAASVKIGAISQHADRASPAGSYV